MPDLTSAIQPWLLDGEEVLSTAEDLVFIEWRPHTDMGDRKELEGLVLTNRRLIVVSKDQEYLYSVAGLRALSERLRGVNPRWPYQASAQLSNGSVIVVETAKIDMDERGRNLSNLLTRALITLDR